MAFILRNHFSLCLSNNILVQIIHQIINHIFSKVFQSMNKNENLSTSTSLGENQCLFWLIKKGHIKKIVTIQKLSYKFRETTGVASSKMSITESDHFPNMVLAGIFVLLAPVLCGTALGIIIWLGNLAIRSILKKWNQRQPDSGYQQLAQVEQEEWNGSENEQENFSDSSNDQDESDQDDSGGSSKGLEHQEN